MKALETSLRNLLEGTKQFQIPLFQRPYSWNKENWQALWEDLLSIYKKEVEGSYFLGPIVTESRHGTAEGISPFTVIDGQQRLTTLTLLLATLRDYIKKNKPNLQEIADEIHEESLINRFKKDDKHYKILPTQEDRDIYKSIINNTCKETETGKICEAYDFFYEKICNPNPDLEEETELQCELFKTVILEKLVFINITSDQEQDDPYLIFESLNYKGQELTQADLVRNYIFMQLPNEKREKLYKEKWMPIQEEFKADLKDSGDSAKELTTAFWTFLRKDGKSVSQKNVYKETKNYFKGNKIEQKLERLTRFTRYYQRIRFCERESNSKLREKFYRLNRLDFTTSRIFLINIYDCYENEIISLQDFLKILQYLESYFVRRLFVKILTKSLGGVFTKLYSQIQKKGYKDLVEGLHATLSEFEGNKRWPNNQEFCENFISFSLYNQNQRERAKMILESLENWQNKEQVNPNNLTIEHIMPQKLNESWQEMLGERYDTIHKEWLHTVGNLTLTAYNSELSDKPFKEKKEYLSDSNISLNRYFENVSVWNEEEIKRRADHLADKAVEIWPR
ncbi:MAG: DUF262 domain-containing protein [Cyanobacteria bacterium SW_9_44_58]|nr:MAG: DUF262 domain-containing protein [Cyanobacteria bacterium SW_9_44_58]